jgi:tetratricopeptide (TPR) repeat protein
MHRRWVSFALVLAVVALSGCASTGKNYRVDARPKAQMFEGMGTHGRTITTSSAEAQAYFNQGLAWMYAFNHDEAIRSFARAADLDPECAMAWWGIALCEGPNYNDPVLTQERSVAAWRVLREARARIDSTTPLERALIEALSTRYTKSPKKDRTELEQAYADAMAEVWATYPDDSDVDTLYAEAMTADDLYRTLSPDQMIQHMYMVHNAHMLAYSAMMVGREAEAMAAARSMWANLPGELLENVGPYIDLWMTSVYDVQKRFGRWDDILAEPQPPEYLPITTSIWRAHRAVAYAAKHDFAGAEREQDAFLQAKEAIPEESVFGGDPSHRILEVSELFIAGEIALQKGEWEEAAEIEEQHLATWAKADEPTTTSCKCIPSI